MDEKYEKIIDLPRPESPTRAKMPLQRRAAQFAPFAALSGFGEMLAEDARVTQAEVFLDESEIAQIDACLRKIRDDLANMPSVRGERFLPDAHKSGGSYREFHGKAVKIDEYGQKMHLDNGQIIEFGAITKLFLD